MVLIRGIDIGDTPAGAFTRFGFISAAKVIGGRNDVAAASNCWMDANHIFGVDPSGGAVHVAANPNWCAIAGPAHVEITASR